MSNCQSGSINRISKQIISLLYAAMNLLRQLKQVEEQHKILNVGQIAEFYWTLYYEHLFQCITLDPTNSATFPLNRLGFKYVGGWDICWLSFCNIFLDRLRLVFSKKQPCDSLINIYPIDMISQCSSSSDPSNYVWNLLSCYHCFLFWLWPFYLWLNEMFSAQSFLRAVW